MNAHRERTKKSESKWTIIVKGANGRRLSISQIFFLKNVANTSNNICECIII
jgi:hypothetical protein